MIITKTPNTFAPSNNPIIFGFETDTTDILYFNVVVKSADTENIISKNKVFVAPNKNTADFDISRILSNLVETPVVNSTETLINLNGTLRYYIEVYPSNDVEDIVTSDIYTVYNGRINQYQAVDEISKEFQNNQLNVFLTDQNEEQKLHHTADASLYFLVPENSPLSYFNYLITLVDGTVINKRISFTNPENKSLHRILVSPSLLAVENDLLTNQINNIKVVGYNSSNIAISEEIIYHITAFRCGIDVVNLYWENEQGGFDYHTFTQPKKDISVEKQTIQTNGILNKINGVFTPSTRTINVNKNVNYTVVSAPLRDKEFDVISNIIASKNVFIETITGDLIPIQITNQTVQILQKRYSKQHNRLTLSFATNDNIDILMYTDINTNGFDYVLDIIF